MTLKARVPPWELDRAQQQFLERLDLFMLAVGELEDLDPAATAAECAAKINEILVLARKR